ncbi:MAG: immunity protein Tsi6 family protein [Gordonia sp. (in: high G+C Gram-positive bacteria)]|uniref:immunity protein Tsi6 family protein n=1 Tax=Gordonia sp. (in: high G+C Gram-positive bacteria) TaxID=84139 RepID=UPI0039E3824A
MEAQQSAVTALRIVDERLQLNSQYGVYVHAKEQLDSMLASLNSREPIAEDREWVDIGLMAAREVDSSDPELAGALMDADYDFKHADG